MNKKTLPPGPQINITPTPAELDTLLPSIMGGWTPSAEAVQWSNAPPRPVNPLGLSTSDLMRDGLDKMPFPAPGTAAFDAMIRAETERQKRNRPARPEPTADELAEQERFDNSPAEVARRSEGANRAAAAQEAGAFNRLIDAMFGGPAFVWENQRVSMVWDCGNPQCRACARANGRTVQPHPDNVIETTARRVCPDDPSPRNLTAEQPVNGTPLRLPAPVESDDLSESRK